MKLKTALQRITKFTGDRKSGILRGVRFLEAIEGECPAKVFASNGRVGVIIDLDPDVNLPTAVLDGEFVANVAKMAAKADNPPEFTADGYGRVTATLGEFSQSVMSAPPSQFADVPRLPELASWVFVPLWPTIRSVVPFTGKPRDGGRAHVKFSARGVETTDTTVVARAEVPGLGDGLVPTEMFKNWTSGDVAVAFEAGKMFVKRGGDELRFAELQRGTFPDLLPIVPVVHDGPRLAVPREDLAAACDQAMRTSPSNAVELAFADDTVTVRSYCKDKEAPAAHAVITGAVIEPATEPMRAMVAGKALCSLLKACSTPAVVLGYLTPHTPVRVESGAFVGCAWQLAETT